MTPLVVILSTAAGYGYGYGEGLVHELAAGDDSTGQLLDMVLRALVRATSWQFARAAGLPGALVATVVVALVWRARRGAVRLSEGRSRRERTTIPRGPRR